MDQANYNLIENCGSNFTDYVQIMVIAIILFSRRKGETARVFSDIVVMGGEIIKSDYLNIPVLSLIPAKLKPE